MEHMASMCPSRMLLVNCYIRSKRYRPCGTGTNSRLKLFTLEKIWIYNISYIYVHIFCFHSFYCVLHSSCISIDNLLE